ncbi:MAG: methyltransferase domain-containing protein [Patescibacteria group bacterium]
MSLKKTALKVADRLGLFSKIPRTRIARFLERQATAERTLDLGGGSGPYTRFFPNRVGADIAPGPGVDYVVDAHDLSVFSDGEFSCVLSTEALEHMHDPARAISEIYRVLAPGGTLILTTRFLFPLHDAPHDYFRFTRYGLEHLLRSFGEVSIVEESNTLETFAVLFERVALETDTLWLKPLSIIWILLSKLFLMISPVITKEYGDVRRSKQSDYPIMASGYYVVATK